MAAVQRRDEPRKFLDASLVPVEHALRARAAVLEVEATEGESQEPDDEGALMGCAVKRFVAAEHRALADELHHW